MTRKMFIKMLPLLLFIRGEKAEAQIGPSMLVLAVGAMASCAIIYVATRPAFRTVKVIRLEKHFIGERNPDGSHKWITVAINTIPFSDSGNYFPAFSDYMAGDKPGSAIYRCIDLGAPEDQLTPIVPRTVGPVIPEQRWYSPEELGIK